MQMNANKYLRLLAIISDIIGVINCIFCKIANKKIPTDFLYEDELIVAFYDIKPLAPVHILIIPKAHIESIAALKDQDEKLAGRMIIIEKKLADKESISEKGYKLLFRV